MTSKLTFREVFGRRLRLAAVVLFVGAGWWPWYLAVRVAKLPLKPNPAMGLIEPYNDHGATVYMKVWEYWFDHAFFIIWAIAFLFIVVGTKLTKGRIFPSKVDGLKP
jgi:hypothetical protein